MSEQSTVELKLIGAETYCCRPAGIMFPVHAGDIVPVNADKVDHLLRQTYRVDSHEYPVWTQDLKAEIRTAKRKPMSIEQRREMERQQGQDAEKLARAERERDEAQAREAELKARVDRLEAAILGDGAEEEKPAPVAKKKAPAKKTTRKRAATKAA